MPAEPWTLQPSPSTSSLGSADSTGHRVGAGVGLGLGVPRGGGGGGGGGASNNISNQPNTTTSRSSLPGSSIGNRLSSSNSDTLHSSSEDESTTLPGGEVRPRTRGMSLDVSQLAVASNPLLGVGPSPSCDLQQQYQLHYYQQQQQQRQQQYGYFDASGQGALSPGAGVGIGTGPEPGVVPSSSGRRAAETIIHFPDHIPSLQLVSFTPPPSSPVVGSFSTTATPNASYAHNYSHPYPHHPHQQVPPHNADTIAPPSSSSSEHHNHPLPSIPPATAATTAATTKPSYIDESGVEHSSKFQAIRKRFSMGAATATGISGGPATAGGAPDRIERRTSMTNNNNSNNNNKETAVRQYTKDSTKTLTSESTTGLLMREELKDDSSLMHNKVVGAGVGGMGLAMDERTYSAASGTIHFQELEYGGVTRRGSTMTTASNNTQTTYRLNVHIPPHRTDYYPEKGGYDIGSHDKSHPYNYNPINLSNLSPTATAPATPITLRRNSLFGLAGSNNNNNPAPNGKRYIDTRKRNKNQSKGEKALAKASFKKAKTLFSNERTFIHWIKFGMLLGALAMTLLNFAGDEVAKKGIEQSLANRVGQIGKNVGVTLLVICLVCLLYAAASYHWRHLGIVNDKGFERYFDRVGPTCLTVALLATYTINVVLTMQVSSLMDRDFEPSSIFLNNNNNNNNLGQHPLQPLAPPPSISPPLAGVNQTESVAPPPSSPPPPTQPQRPVFDTPYLPPGSTILIDSDEDDGSDFEGSHPPSDLEDPTVTTASSKTESSGEEEGSGLSSSRDDFEESNSSSSGDEDDDDN